jgi:DNA repair protein RadC
MKMENTQVVEKKQESAAEPVGNGSATQQKGDYTRYYYQNIDRLWDAVEQLQHENNRLKGVLKETSTPESIIGELKIVYEPGKMPQVKTAEDVAAQLTDIKDATKEVFVAFYLDTKNKVMAREIISIGTLNASLIHPRETFRGAIIHNANSIILAHNHPSGDCKPSQQDEEVTKLMKNAGELLGISLLDHIIVGNNGFYSLKEHGAC